MENPREHIGKFICYDVEYGACWAKITDVRKINMVSGEEEVFIVEDRISRNGESISRHKDPTIVLCREVDDSEIFGGEIDDELAEKLFEVILTSGNERTALELGGKDLVEMLDEYLKKGKTNV